MAKILWISQYFGYNSVTCTVCSKFPDWKMLARFFRFSSQYGNHGIPVSSHALWQLTMHFLLIFDRKTLLDDKTKAQKFISVKCTHFNSKCRKMLIFTQYLRNWWMKAIKEDLWIVRILSWIVCILKYPYQA